MESKRVEGSNSKGGGGERKAKKGGKKLKRTKKKKKNHKLKLKNPRQKEGRKLGVYGQRHQSRSQLGEGRYR